VVESLPSKQMTRVRIPTGALKKMEKETIKNFHDRYYKVLLLIPLIILLLSVGYMAYFYSENQDFIRKDISLTGGTLVTIEEQRDVIQIRQDLSNKLENLDTRGVYDILTGEQIAVIIATKTEMSETRKILEDYLGFELTEENSSFEFTDASLGEAFYRQLIIAIILAFSMMGLVVFIIFGKNIMIKFYSAILALLSVKTAYSNISFINVVVAFTLIVLICVMFYYSYKNKTKKIFPTIFTFLSILFFVFSFFLTRYTLPIILLILFVLSFIYFKHSIPSCAVILSATLDLFMTLALVNFLGMRLSSAGIVAFLMIIGYSVDTDILLATKILKREEGTVNQRILSAMKTGLTMTLTSLLAISFAFFVVRSFSDVLAQIFTIMMIGLSFDLINTWITNVSITKWYINKK
jgi:preprotein translocase subunit SecF